MTDDAIPPSPMVWQLSMALPHRYSTHYPQYRAAGGMVDVASDAKAYAGSEPLRDVERFLALSLAFDQIRKERVAGDIAEIGVYKGATAAVLARHAGRLGRTLWLLDTFEGFDDRDFVGLDAGRARDFGDTSLDTVRQRVGEENTIYIQGYFPETAARLPADRTYCLVSIDTDLHAPIKAALEYFYPRMEPGGYIVVHDYGSMQWLGAEKAVDEFFSDKPECVIQLPDSAGSAIVRRNRPSEGRANWLGIRQVVRADEWHIVALGGATEILTEGWSAPEEWGVWGVGASQRIAIAIDSMDLDTAVLECEVWAYVPDDWPGRAFDVRVDGVPFATWRFTPQENRGIRSVMLLGNPRSHTVEFRPHSVVSPRDVDPSHQDARPLALALCRFMVRKAGG